MPVAAILDPDGRPTSASTLLVVHRAVRRDLARFPVALRRMGEDPAAADDRAVAFRAHWESFRGILVSHHRQEDKELFPALRLVAPGLGDVITALEGKHQDLDAELDRVAGWVERLPDADAVAGAVSALEGLSDFLVFHLDTEEAHLVPVMLSSGFAEAEAAAPGGEEDGAVDFGDVAPDFALPWCADGLDEAVAAVLVAGLPAALQAELPAWRTAYEEHLARWM